MEQIYEKLISCRCEKEMLENEEYQELQRQLLEANKSQDVIKYEEVSSSIHILTAKICYLAGVKDTLKIID